MLLASSCFLEFPFSKDWSMIRWRMPFVWIPHLELSSAPLSLFLEPPHKPASVLGNNHLRDVRLESFSRTDVTVLTSVPLMIAMILPELPLFSLFIRIV